MIEPRRAARLAWAMIRRLAVPLLFVSACAGSAAAPGSAPANEGRAAEPVPYEQLRTADPGFDAWRSDFISRQVAQGWDRAFLELQLSPLTPDDRVVSLDGRQPEFAKPTSAYVTAAVSADRIAEGRRRRESSPWMAQIEARYGVPAEILIGVWAQESAFGRIQGDFDVVRSFATLAYDGRRRAWAESQLLDALRIIRSGAVARERLRGSWAGAMGQTQFLPENYLKLGQDFDGNGRVDIWGSEQDALASAANLLFRAGWAPGQSWAVEVTLPDGFDYSVAETLKLTPSGWAGRGVRRADGRTWSQADSTVEAALLLPAGAPGPAFLAFPNHYVIRRYNNSTAYALAIGLLADRIGGGGELQRAWPVEQPLSSDQRINAQRALTLLGFDPGGVDGVIGVGTRAALRAWQAHNGLPADGHLTVELAERLRAQAGL